MAGLVLFRRAGPACFRGFVGALLGVADRAVVVSIRRDLVTLSAPLAALGICLMRGYPCRTMRVKVQMTVLAVALRVTSVAHLLAIEGGKRSMGLAFLESDRVWHLDAVTLVALWLVVTRDTVGNRGHVGRATDRRFV